MNVTEGPATRIETRLPGYALRCAVISGTSVELIIRVATGDTYGKIVAREDGMLDVTLVGYAPIPVRVASLDDALELARVFLP